MKKLENKKSYLKTKNVFLMLLLVGLFAFNPTKAQVNVSVNISSQAIWGPVGYDYVDYYYIPEVDVFYYVPTAQFIYWNGNQQIFASNLPPTFHVDLYSTYKVIVNEPKPYKNHGYYVSNYAKYKHGGPKQNIIRDSNDQKYYAVKGHPKHNGNQQNNNNNAKHNPDNQKSNNNNVKHNSDNQKSMQRENKPMQQERQAERKSKPAQQERQVENRKQNQPSNQPRTNGGQKGKGH